MVEPAKNDAHIMEIPVTGDGANLTDGNAEADAFLDKAAAEYGHHLLGEIAGSARHLLLLKLWQQESSRLGRRAGELEALMDAAHRDAFFLSAAFLAFHGLCIALLFAASMVVASQPPTCAVQTTLKAVQKWIKLVEAKLPTRIGQGTSVGADPENLAPLYAAVMTEMW